MSATIYARISTKDRGQPNDNQLRELRAFAERLGYAIYREFGGKESGGSARLLRCDTITTVQKSTVKRPFN